MKRTISTLLAICMVFTLCIPAMAAGMQNFVQYNMYDNNFTDVPATHWAMPSVKACYEYALMYGSSNTKFNPSGELTIAEALVMADRVHSIYNTGETAVFSGGNPWYKPYVDYAVNKGIVSASDFSDVSQRITRAQMAYVFYNALPEKEFTAINSIRNIPDVNGEHKFHTEIKALYNAGILTGSDSLGTFYPDRNITRAEAAAIISRVSDVNLRKTFTITEPLTAEEIKIKCSPAVALVESYDSEGEKIASGSGFFTDEEGSFITAIDCVKGAITVKIKTADKKEYTVESVYDCDTQNNLVLLKTNAENTAFLETDTSKITAGEDAYALYSFAGNVLLSEGDVSNPDYSGRIRCNINVPSSAAGAVLVNKYGKVTGIKDASTEFLAVPVKYAEDLVKGNPLPIEKFSEFLESEPVLYASTNEVKIAISSTQSVLINFNPALRDHIVVTEGRSGIAKITELKYISDHELMVTFAAKDYGRTKFYVYYTFGPVASKRLDITITVGSIFYEPPYYWIGAPSYNSVTGLPCEYSYNPVTGETSNWYEEGAGIYGYEYTDRSEPASYMKALEANGWTLYDIKEEPGVTAYFYIKGNNLIGINVNYNDGVVYIVFYEAEQDTYKNGAPTYHDITGIPCLASYFIDTDSYLEGYYADADIYDYQITSFEDVVTYIDTLTAQGWTYEGYTENETSYFFYLTSSSGIIAIELNLYYYIIAILVT